MRAFPARRGASSSSSSSSRTAAAAAAEADAAGAADDELQDGGGASELDETLENVMSSLSDEIGKRMHAVEIKTMLPGEAG